MAQHPYRVPNIAQGQTQGETGEEASRWLSSIQAQGYPPPAHLRSSSQYLYPYDRQPQNPLPASHTPNTLLSTAQSYSDSQTQEPWGWKNVRPFDYPPLRTPPDKGHNFDGNPSKPPNVWKHFAEPLQEVENGNARAESPWPAQRLPNPMAEPYHPRTPALQNPLLAATDTPGQVNDISVGANNQFPPQLLAFFTPKPFLRPPPGLFPHPKYSRHLTYPRSTPHLVFPQDAEAPVPSTDLFGNPFLWNNMTTEETYLRTLWQRKKEKDLIREETQKWLLVN